jgi:hypothetical protein
MMLLIHRAIIEYIADDGERRTITAPPPGVPGPDHAVTPNAVNLDFTSAVLVNGTVCTSFLYNAEASVSLAGTSDR